MNCASIVALVAGRRHTLLQLSKHHTALSQSGILSTLANVRIRNFNWSDLDTLQHLLNEAGRHGHRDWPSNSKDLRSELEFPRVKPEQNIALAMNGSEAVGYAIVEPESNIGRSVIGLGSSLVGLATRNQLLEWAMDRAKTEAPIAHLSTRDNESELEKLIDQFGWKKVRKYLKLVASAELIPAPAVMPEGFSVRTMLGLDEVPELTYLQNSAFSEHFGYSPNTEDEISARLTAADSNIDDVVMIHDANEQLVAYCWTQVQDRAGSKVGRIGMTGVLPTARKKGLGRAIAEAGYNHLLTRNVDSVELDVDSINAPAIKVYSSMGFERSSEVNWWELTL